MNILVLNAGSSSQKCSLFSLSDPLPERADPIWEGQTDWTHLADRVELRVKSQAGSRKWEMPSHDRAAVLTELLTTLWQGEQAVLTDPGQIDRVGHRVVHGGETYRQSTFITPEVQAKIEQLSLFAPIHHPINLEGIRVVEQVLGSTLPQIAVFDTSFHSQLPLAAAIYPGPHRWIEQGIRRYGFHGISHHFCSQRAAQLLGREVADLSLITCHLGNGCSLAAVRGGVSVDTTMGFTPLDGLMMGTRSGAVDPGILIHLMRQGMGVEELDHLLNHGSGLAGLSELSADLRQIQAAIEAGNAQARLALEVYIHRLRALMGSMLASLDRLDALVFAGGVGENAVGVRAAACEGWKYLGLELDPQRNGQAIVSRDPQWHDVDIATPSSQVRILVIHTQEDWAIAQECWRLGSLA